MSAEMSGKKSFKIKVEYKITDINIDGNVRINDFVDELSDVLQELVEYHRLKASGKIEVFEDMKPDYL